MGLNELLKKNKFKSELSKFKLNNSQIDEVIKIYDYVITIFLNSFSEELKTNKDLNRSRIDSRLIEDIGRIVCLNKNFLINDLTMEYIINKKNSLTVLQFLNNFHYLAQTNIDNDNFHFNVSLFIKYLMNRAYEDNTYLESVLVNKSLSKITIDYLNCVKDLSNTSDPEKALDMFNYLVGIIWYEELINEYPDIVTDINEYVINHFDEIMEEIKLDDAISDSSYEDNVTSILDTYKNKKVKKLN